MSLIPAISGAMNFYCISISARSFCHTFIKAWRAQGSSWPACSAHLWQFQGTVYIRALNIAWHKHHKCDPCSSQLYGQASTARPKCKQSYKRIFKKTISWVVCQASLFSFTRKHHWTTKRSSFEHCQTTTYLVDGRFVWLHERENKWSAMDLRKQDYPSCKLKHSSSDSCNL